MTEIQNGTPEYDVRFTTVTGLIQRNSTPIKIQVYDSDSSTHEPDNGDDTVIDVSKTVDGFMKDPKACGRKNFYNCVEVDIVWLDKRDD